MVDIVSRVVGRWASTGSLKQEPNRLGYKKNGRVIITSQAAGDKRPQLNATLALHVGGAGRQDANDATLV